MMLPRVLALALSAAPSGAYQLRAVSPFATHRTAVSPFATHRTSQQLLLSAAAPQPAEGEGIAPALNVLGTELCCCCADVGGSGIGTGFFRDGFCSTGFQDEGRHTVCVEVTSAFLKFSAAVGNDLSTPFPAYNFPGLKDGDCWCLCASRWAQALANNCAPKLYLQATHAKTLDYASLDQLKKYALDADDAEEVVAELDALRSRLEKSL